MIERIAVTLLAVTALSATMVTAQVPPPNGCMDAKAYDAAIRELDHETVAFTARFASGNLFFIYVNDAERTFTLVFAPAGHPEWRCPMGVYGTEWRFVEPGEPT